MSGLVDFGDWPEAAAAGSTWVRLGTALLGPTTTGLVLWMLACIGQLAVTVWVLARWWRGNGAGGLQWVGITPILIIPVVGNVLTPLAGMALGQPAWAAAQFGLGAFLWPLIIVLLFVRIATQGLWPERLLPTGFITIAPPAVIGLSLLQLGTAEPWAQACWGVALFFLLWSLQILRRMLAQPLPVFPLDHAVQCGPSRHPTNHISGSESAPTSAGALVATPGPDSARAMLFRGRRGLARAFASRAESYSLRHQTTESLSTSADYVQRLTRRQLTLATHSAQHSLDPAAGHIVHPPGHTPDHTRTARNRPAYT